MTRPIPALALDFLKRAEACRLAAYTDSAGHLTIGYGHTGPDVREGARCKQSQADQWLAEDLGIAARRLEARVHGPVLATLSDHRYGALLSFVFNVGAAPQWHIWRVLNEGALDQVP